MPLFAVNSWICGLAFTAGLAREWVCLLIPSKRDPVHNANPSQLRRTIVGHSKKDVARLLGPPPAAGAIDAQPASPTYWMSNTWYYPFDLRRHSALAVQFDEGRVVEVEFIEG